MGLSLPAKRDIKKVSALCISHNAFYKQLTNKEKNERVFSIGSYLHWIVSLGGGKGLFFYSALSHMCYS